RCRTSRRRCRQTARCLLLPAAPCTECSSTGWIQSVVATPCIGRCAVERSGRQIPKTPEGARRQWAADRALRPAMRSPGRPEPSRLVQREFWRLIASGATTAEARSEEHTSELQSREKLVCRLLLVKIKTWTL